MDLKSLIKITLTLIFVTGCSMDIKGQKLGTSIQQNSSQQGNVSEQDDSAPQPGWGLPEENSQTNDALVTMRTSFVAEAEEVVDKNDSSSQLFVTAFGQAHPVVSEKVDGETLP